MRHSIQYQDALLKFSGIGIAILLILMPFHAALVTVLGSLIDYKIILQSWKEVLIVALLAVTAIAYWRDRTIFRFDNLNILALFIVVFSVIVTLLIRPSYIGALAGIKTNLLVLLLFLVAQVPYKYFNQKRMLWLIILPAGLVGFVGLLQPWIFGPELLSKIGYSASSIIGGQYIDSARSTMRIFSTLGGPNQLGTYLIIPLALSLAYGLHSKKWYWLLISILFCIPIYMTHSRSAWLGVVFAIIVVIATFFTKKLQIFVAIGVCIALLMGGILIFSANPCGQLGGIRAQFIRGTCINNVIVGSDSQHITAIQNGLQAVTRQPWGYGLGTAGPASFYTNKAMVTENWYLQIAIEIGLLGLGLYIAFFVILVIELYKASQLKNQYSYQSKALLACLVGILVASLFLHSLTDSTLAIVLFLLLGINKGRQVV